MSELPRWSAPIVGAVVGAFLGLRSSRDIEGPLLFIIAGGAAIGGLAGCLIFLFDSKPASESNPYASPSDFAFDKMAPAPSGVIPRFLAVTSVVLFFAPVMGLGVGVAALIANRNSHDWAKTVSKVGVGIGVVVSALFFAAMFIG